MSFAILALVSAALFAGAALYINFAEHPARMKLPVKDTLVQWSSAYDRGFIMQASLAVVGGLLAIWSWWLT